MRLLTALLLEAVLPGPQILMALGNYVGEEPPPPTPRVGERAIVVFGLLVACIAGLVWLSNRPKYRLRRNPTAYAKAWDALIDAEHRGASQAELRRLRADVDEAKRQSRMRWKDETETTVYDDER